MGCNNFVTGMVAGCFFALAFSDSLLSQDAGVPTRQGFELMNQGRYREAEEFLLPAFEIAGPANATAVYNLASLYPWPPHAPTESGGSHQ